MRWVEGQIKLRLAQSLYMRLSDCVQETKKTSGKSVEFDLPNYLSLQTIADCELGWFDIFDSSNLVQPLRLFRLFQQEFWLAYCNVLDESTKHGDIAVVRFANKVCFENWK